MSTQADWWRRTLAADYDSGRLDAERGVYEPPWPNSDDFTDQEQNREYKRGFNQRRMELGDKFRWAE